MMKRCLLAALFACGFSSLAFAQSNVLLNYKSSATQATQVSPTAPLPIGSGFSQTARATDLSVSGTTSNVALGATGTTARVCNIGANSAYVALGGSTVTVTTANGILVLAGSCVNLNIGTATYLAGITSTSTTTLQTSIGSGIASLGGGGGGGAPGGPAGGVLSGSYPNPGFATPTVIPNIYGGNLAASELNLFSTSNGSPSGDSIVAETNVFTIQSFPSHNSQPVITLYSAGTSGTASSGYDVDFQVNDSLGAQQTTAILNGGIQGSNTAGSWVGDLDIVIENAAGQSTCFGFTGASPAGLIPCSDNAFVFGTSTQRLKDIETVALEIGTGSTMTSSGPGGALTAIAYSAVGQLPGTTTNDNASSGNVGQLIDSSISQGNAVSMMNGQAADITTLALTAGDWDVSIVPYNIPDTTTALYNCFGSISSTLNTLDQTVGKWVGIYPNGAVFGANAVPCGGAVTYRVSLSGSSTIHFVGFSVFGVSTDAMYGYIRARRVR